MMPALTYMSYYSDGQTGIITLNHQDTLNALNSEMITELGLLFESLNEDAQKRVIIIRGEGRAFAAGADIKQMQMMTPDEAQEYSILGNRVFDLIDRFTLPVIAAVNGYALGGGLELMLSCDFAIASRAAKFGLPELTLGLIPGFGGSRRIAHRIGLQRAKELIFTGRVIGADEARELGLVVRVTEPEELMECVLDVAKEIAMVSPHALKTAKALLNGACNPPVPEGVLFEAQQFRSAFSHPDASIGMAAFVMKSKPVWKNDQ